MKKCILAIDAGGTFLKSALVCDGKIVPDTYVKIGVDSDRGKAEEVHAAYLKLIGEEKKIAASLGFEIASAAVDTPGPFDFASGTPLMKHKYRAIYGISLRPWFSELLPGVPVYFVHDSAAFIRGVAAEVPDCSRVSGVMLGTGLGFAMAVDGKPLVNENGAPRVSIYASAYRDGTAEDYISGRGILRRYNLYSSVHAPDAKTVGDRADSGDVAAIRAYSETGKFIAEVVSPILKEYKIEALIIGGQIARSFYLFEGELRAGLSDVPTLKYVKMSDNIDDCHLLGSASSVL